MMSSKNPMPEGINIPRRHNVKGAPFSINECVRIAKLVDIDSFGYLKFDPEDLIGQLGVVKHFDYDCGCGQTYPGDPMIGIELKNGQIHEFWKEELQPAN